MKIPSYIQFTEDAKNSLKSVLKSLNPDKVGYLVDENTRMHCLPKLNLPADALIVEIASGEKHKNLDTCTAVWSQLTDWGFSRNSILVNVGGGVIGDLGGFVASTYKRGIRFINIPTTLLAAVDANIGGKLGIDFKGFKNHIGVFKDPDAVIISDDFLTTLPERELRSGFAEVIKHGLIQSTDYWDSVATKVFPNLDWMEVIKGSVIIKSKVVKEDPTEKGLRKILNFGHTIGHGVETWFLNNGKDLLHGEAIAIGMITEAFLSSQQGLLSKEKLEELSNYLMGIYGWNQLPDYNEIKPIMAQDKKNTGSTLNFSLLEGFGNCVFDQQVKETQIIESLAYYQGLNK